MTSGTPVALFQATPWQPVSSRDLFVYDFRKSDVDPVEKGNDVQKKDTSGTRTYFILPKRNLEWLHEMNLRFLRLQSSESGKSGALRKIAKICVESYTARSGG
jgi:hypothetical protein